MSGSSQDAGASGAQPKRGRAGAHQRCRLATLDFEASSLDENSYPIEVGVAISEDNAITQTYEALIRPREAWVRNGRWSKAAERVHGISQASLEDGMDADAVCDALDTLLKEQVVYADGGDFDAYWLERLYGSRKPAFSLCRHDQLPAKALLALRQSHKVVHRALADALWLNEALQTIWQDA